MKKIIQDTNKEYHSKSDIIGASGLKQYLKSPAHYHSYKTEDKKSTPAMMFGSAYHYLIGEPEQFDERCYIFNVDQRPDKDKGITSTKNQEWKKDLYSKYNVITEDEFFNIRKMKNRIFSDETLKSKLKGGHAELSHYLEDFEGVNVKIRPDYIKEYDNYIICMDFKTTQDASEKGFEKQCCYNDYPLQAAFYVDVLQKIYGKTVYFSYIPQEKTPPFAFLVRHCDDLYIEAGRQLYKKAIALHKECTKLNRWDDYKHFIENPTKVANLTVPKWYLEKYGIENLLLNIELNS